jgi:phage shock protein C
MTQIETGPPTVQGGEAQPRLRRTRAPDRIIAGVCGGLGRYTNIDPVWYRLGFVLLTLAGGAGILIYLIAWLVIPEAGTGESDSGDLGSRGPVVVGIALIAIGLMLLINTLVPWFDQVVWPLTVVAAGAGLIFIGSRRERD